MSWIYLSYPLNSEAFGYGDGDRFRLKYVREMCCGDTSNNSEFSMPTHYGTHIDYPFHFSEAGKKSSAYKAEDFIFQHVDILDITDVKIENYLIRNKHLNLSEISDKTELLIIKTGFCEKRSSSEYWEFGYGFHAEVAAFLKDKIPSLKVIAFDLISLNSYQNRPEGRKAHHAFLMDHDILIVEEVDLRMVNDNTEFEQVVIAPLQLENADGAPCTIFANVRDD